MFKNKIWPVCIRVFFSPTNEHYSLNHQADRKLVLKNHVKHPFSSILHQPAMHCALQYSRLLLKMGCKLTAVAYRIYCPVCIVFYSKNSRLCSCQNLVVSFPQQLFTMCSSCDCVSTGDLDQYGLLWIPRMFSTVSVLGDQSFNKGTEISHISLQISSFLFQRWTKWWTFFSG